MSAGAKLLPAAERVLGRGHVLPGHGPPGVASAAVAVPGGAGRSSGGRREPPPQRRDQAALPQQESAPGAVRHGSGAGQRSVSTRSRMYFLPKNKNNNSKLMYNSIAQRMGMFSDTSNQKQFTVS